MLTLEDIFEDHNNKPSKRKILFEEGMWCIYEKTPQYTDDKFHLIHRCMHGVKAVPLKNYYNNGVHDISCRGCGDVPSEGILGLLNLHKWGMGEY